MEFTKEVLERSLKKIKSTARYQILEKQCEKSNKIKEFFDRHELVIRTTSGLVQGFSVVVLDYLTDGEIRESTPLISGLTGLLGMRNIEIIKNVQSIKQNKKTAEMFAMLAVECITEAGAQKFLKAGYDYKEARQQGLIESEGQDQKEIMLKLCQTIDNCGMLEDFNLRRTEVQYLAPKDWLGYTGRYYGKNQSQEVDENNIENSEIQEETKEVFDVEDFKDVDEIESDEFEEEDTYSETNDDDLTK